MSIDEASPALTGIGVEHVTAYLGGAGWKRRADFPRPEVLVFEGPPDDHGEPITAVIPSSASMRDYRVRLARLLDALGSLEERSPYEIALDMQSPGVDRLRARVISDIAAVGSIPLPFASVLLHGLRDLVAAAACAEEDPRPFFTKATKIGSDHAQSWRFGQTQLGSFVATIESPVVPAAGQQPSPGATPFARRVTERIMRGLDDLRGAVLDGRPDALFGGFQRGLNANMCEALLSFRSSGMELQMEFSIQWSTRIAPPRDVTPRVLIEGRGFELLDATAKRLRTPQESSERTFLGDVVRLQRESDDERIAVIRFVEDGRRIQAKIHLGVEDYKIACDAHREGTKVQLKGRLERVGNKQWSIFGVEGFGTVDGSTDIERARAMKEILDR